MNSVVCRDEYGRGSKGAGKLIGGALQTALVLVHLLRKVLSKLWGFGTPARVLLKACRSLQRTIVVAWIFRRMQLVPRWRHRLQSLLVERGSFCETLAVILGLLISVKSPVSGNVCDIISLLALPGRRRGPPCWLVAGLDQVPKY